MTELLRQPNAMKKLQEEVRRVGGEITEDDLDKMPYLKAVSDGGGEKERDVAEVNGMTVHKRFPLLVVATPL